MKERFWKASRWLSVMAGLLVIAVYSSAFGAGAGSIEFGIAAMRSKVDYGTYLYSSGQHSIVVIGSEVYVAYPSRNTAGDYEVCVGKSLDGGISWERPEIVANSPNIDMEGVVIAVGPADPGNPGDLRRKIHIAWGYQDPATYKASIIYANRIFDPLNPRAVFAWSTPVDVSGSENVDNYVKSIAADNLGGVHIVFCTRFDANGWGGGIFYSRSTNGGASFDEIAYKIATNNNGQPTITAEAIGNIYVSWSAGDAIYFTKRLANSSAWTPPVPVNGTHPGGGGGAYVSIAVQNASTIYVATPYDKLYVAKSTDGGVTWSQYVVDERGDDISLVSDGNGALTLASRSTVGNGSSIYRSTNGGVTWSKPVLLDAVADYVNLAVDAAGKVYIIYADNYDHIYFTKEK